MRGFAAPSENPELLSDQFFLRQILYSGFTQPRFFLMRRLLLPCLPCFICVNGSVQPRNENCRNKFSCCLPFYLPRWFGRSVQRLLLLPLFIFSSINDSKNRSSCCW